MCSRFIKFTALSVCLFACIPFFAAAFPGISQYIPESSGFYVYYRDYSFERESYVGFLQYDESTYAVRYIAPADKINPKKEVQILFTVDPEKNYTELTGETIITPITPDDTDLINYLHDLVYEISSRRRKAGSWTKQNTKPIIVTEVFLQFGGEVTFTYNYFVPVFNLTSIAETDGVTLFELVTLGALATSQDTSFSDFNGFETRRSVSPSAAIPPLSQKAKPLSFELSGVTITLDTQWEQPIPEIQNFLVLGDGAVFMADVMSFMPPEGDSAEDAPYPALDYLTREAVFSSEGSYIDWTRTTLTRTPRTLKVVGVYSVIPDSTTEEGGTSIVIDVKLCAAKGETVLFAELRVFESAYRANEAYYTALIKNLEKQLGF